MFKGCEPEDLQHDGLVKFQASPGRIIVSPSLVKSERVELMHELSFLQASFTSMRFQEKVNAVRAFEVGTRVDEAEGFAPQQFEFVKYCFMEPFLKNAFAERHCRSRP